MPRIRSLKPEIWLSPQVMNLSRDARLLFVGLITQADDKGRGTADPRKLKGAVFPGDDDIASVRVQELLAEVESQGLVVTYEGNGHGRLYSLPGFTTHQSINKAQDSRYPAPPSGSSTVPIPDHAGITPEGSEGSEGSKTSGTRARAVNHDPVDNSARRARAPDGLKNRRSDPEEIERKRAQAAAIVENLARTKAV